MTDDIYMLAIVALLPLTACLLVLQVDPYHALVIRGIVGAVAALVYALLGAADVALTEALVGTMLSITLYAVAVRSSMSMRVGILSSELATAPDDKNEPRSAEPALAQIRHALTEHHMRLESVPFSSFEEMTLAFEAKEIHAILSGSQPNLTIPLLPNSQLSYSLFTRVPRLCEILGLELKDTEISVNKTTSSSDLPNSLKIDNFSTQATKEHS